MENLIGDDIDRLPDWLAQSDTQVHLYGKAEARPGRKMGHLTFTGATPEDTRAQALRACALLGLGLISVLPALAIVIVYRKRRLR